MKKNYFLIILFLFAIFLTGCGQKTEVTEKRQDFRIPDFGQPERQADIRGIVKSVVGNEVTIYKMERPEAMGEGMGQGMKQEDEEQETTQLSFGGGTGGGPGGGFRPGMGMRGGGQMDDEARTAMLAQVKEMSTGEETVTVPVGIKMLKSGETDSGQPDMVEATLSDIKADSMVSIWLNTEIQDRDIADFVMIMQ